MDRKILFLVLVVFIIFLVFGQEDDDFQPSENWQSEIVDDSGWVGIDSSIAVDADNNPHISHYDQGNRDLKYAYWNGGGWQNEVVDSAGDVGEESGIAIDDNDDPHISYVDATNGPLKYAKKTGDSWSIGIVDSTNGYFTMATAIALDNNEYPHIGYSMRPSGDGLSITKYAYWNGSSWNTETVTMGTDAYFALDSNDTPHLCFKKEDDNEIERIAYAKRTAEGWNVEIVDSSTVAGGDCGIAADSNGYAHIAYNDYGNDAKRYAYWNGTSWNTETIASDVGSEEGTKIAVDGQDRPHIVYIHDDINESLKYAVLNGSSWITETIDKMGNPSIAIDSLDRPHVSHGRTADHTEILKYSVRYLGTRTTTTTTSSSTTIPGTTTSTSSTTTSTSTTITSTTTTSSTSSTTTTISGECPLKGDHYPCDGTVSDFELLAYIDLWVQGEVGDFDLLEAIDNWAG